MLSTNSSSSTFRPIVKASVIDVPPPRPETPLPKYILQFKDFVWFKEAYPDLNNKVCFNNCLLI